MVQILKCHFTWNITELNYYILYASRNVSDNNFFSTLWKMTFPFREIFYERLKAADVSSSILSLQLLHFHRCKFRIRPLSSHEVYWFDMERRRKTHHTNPNGWRGTSHITSMAQIVAKVMKMNKVLYLTMAFRQHLFHKMLPIWVFILFLLLSLSFFFTLYAKSKLIQLKCRNEFISVCHLQILLTFIQLYDGSSTSHRLKWFGRFSFHTNTFLAAHFACLVYASEHTSSSATFIPKCILTLANKFQLKIKIAHFQPFPVALMMF